MDPNVYYSLFQQEQLSLTKWCLSLLIVEIEQHLRAWGLAIWVIISKPSYCYTNNGSQAKSYNIHETTSWDKWLSAPSKHTQTQTDTKIRRLTVIRRDGSWGPASGAAVGGASVKLILLGSPRAAVVRHPRRCWSETRKWEARKIYIARVSHD